MAIGLVCLELSKVMDGRLQRRLFCFGVIIVLTCLSPAKADNDEAAKAVAAGRNLSIIKLGDNIPFLSSMSVSLPSSSSLSLAVFSDPARENKSMASEKPPSSLSSSPSSLNSSLVSRSDCQRTGGGFGRGNAKSSTTALSFGLPGVCSQQNGTR